jgi:hypothetical protein
LSNIYLDSQGLAGVSLRTEAPSAIEGVDFDGSGASDVGKPRPNDERRGSLEMFVVAVLLDLWLWTPPRSACK